MSPQDYSLYQRMAGIHQELLLSGWHIQKTAAGAVNQPAHLATSAWQPTQVPGTVAQHCIAHGLDASNIDDADWWYTAESDLPERVNTSTLEIIFTGLATLAEVWLNGQLLATSQSMFVPLCLPAPLISGRNCWHLCFRSLAQALGQRRPRPSWKTPLVEQQQLRWFRTSLLGRMPGWTQPLPVIGPWQAVHCYEKAVVFLRDSHISTGFSRNNNVSDGAWLKANFILEVATDQIPTGCLKISNQELPLMFRQETGQQESRQQVPRKQEPRKWIAEITTTLADMPRWWPHTHGDSPLVAAELQVTLNQPFNFPLGKLGFKSLELCRDNGKLAFVINGQEIFCRGACWTPQDVVTLSSSAEQLRNSLLQARDAGVNMLRINGTMAYESDDFYSLCDELGILVWQDFMFANMDYPTQDKDFAALIDTEVQHHLRRLSAHCCIAAYCGGNEVYMQAAMVGLPASAYRNAFFDQQLPERCEQLHSGIVYFPSSPCEGDLPFLPNVGTSHYYGVSAYRQPVADAELSQVKFATECLAFSNIPEANTLDKLFQGKQPYMHSPLWQEGVPRMASSGWDFEDVRDFYLTELYGINPVALRAYDTPRYLEYSRVLTGEIMAQTIALWRSQFTPCAGALMWFWRDLQLGAGWGLIDSLGQPKAAYYSWKRTCQPCAIFLLDRGLNGLVIELINETAQGLDLRIELHGYNAQDAETIAVNHSIHLPARSQQTLMADALIGHFTDLPHSYRFGPIQHRLLHARLLDIKTETLVSEDFYFPQREFLSRQRQQGINIEATEIAAGQYSIKVLSPVFLQWVKLDLPGFQLSNNYFHLAPNRFIEIIARSQNISEATPLKGYLEAINLQESLRIRC